MIETMILSFLFGILGGLASYYVSMTYNINKVILLKNCNYKLWITKFGNSHLVTLYKPNGERLSTVIRNDSIDAINYAIN